jgi:endonuclease G
VRKLRQPTSHLRRTDSTLDRSAVTEYKGAGSLLEEDQTLARRVSGKQVQLLLPHIRSPMTVEVKFGWLTFYQLQRPLFRAVADTPYFLARDAPKFAKTIGADGSTLYHPIELHPTNLFHVAARHALQKLFQVYVRNKNFPYTIPLSDLGPSINLGAAAHIYLPDILCIRIMCHTWIPLNKETVFTQRLFHNHPLLRFLSAFIAARIEERYLSVTSSPILEQVKPLIDLSTVSTDDDYLKRERTFLAALLINDKDYSHSNPKIFDSVYDANFQHNMKNEEARLILINKQGLLSVTNAGRHEVVNREIRKKIRLFELGYALQKFYERYPSIRQREYIHESTSDLYTREMDYLFFATKPYIHDLDFTFKPSAGNQLAWRLIVKALRLDAGFKSAERFDVNSPSPISHLFDRFPEPQYANALFWMDVDNVLGDNYLNSIIKVPSNILVISRDGHNAVGQPTPRPSTNYKRPREMQQAMKESLAGLLEKLAIGSNSGSDYLRDLVQRVELPNKIKTRALDVMSGKTQVDARRLVNCLLAFDTNPKDGNPAIGTVLLAVVEELGVDDATLLASMINAYGLVRSTDALRELRARFQIPQYPSRNRGATHTSVGPHFKLIEAREDVELQRWLKPAPDFLDVGMLQMAVRRARSVCRVEVEQTHSRGTGVLIDRDLVLTNFHVLADTLSDLNTNAASTVLRFGAFTAAASAEAGQQVGLDQQNPLVACSQTSEFDFVLLRVDSMIATFEAIAPVTFTLRRPKARSSLHILQHPDGGEMKLALSNNGVIAVDRFSGKVQYVTKAAGGSSGSPCFDEDWSMVALHRAELARPFGAIREGIMLKSIFERIQPYLSTTGIG